MTQLPSGERLHFAMERSTHFLAGKIHYFDGHQIQKSTGFAAG